MKQFNAYLEAAARAEIVRRRTFIYDACVAARADEEALAKYVEHFER